MNQINVTIWNEYRHERQESAVAAVYPDGIHGALKEGLAADDLSIRTATLDEPENGLPPEVLDHTDVLLWWGHLAHGEVADAVVERIRERVLSGMGLIVLHSGHYSKIFKALMGTGCGLKWRVAAEKERLWVVSPAHPAARGIDDYFELPHEEMYGESFDIPDDGKVVFMSWFAGGNVFRSGVAFERGVGRIFYFQPGHEMYPTYRDSNVLKVIGNAIRWARPRLFCAPSAPEFPALEKI